MRAEPQNPAEILAAGVSLLQNFMVSHQFVYTATVSGDSSGGRFASGEFRRGNRWLELHFRDSLGLVTYHAGPVSLGHDDYMWSVLGRRWMSKYPSVSDDPMQAFRDLLSDMEQHASIFLTGSDSDFLRLVKHSDELRKATPRVP